MNLVYDIRDRVMRLSNPSSRKAQAVARSAVAGGIGGESWATAAMRKETGGGRKEESDPEARKLIGPVDVTAVNADGYRSSQERFQPAPPLRDKFDTSLPGNRVF